MYVYTAYGTTNLSVVKRKIRAHHDNMKTKPDRELNVPLSFRIPLSQLQEIEDAVRAEARRHRTDLVEFIWTWAWSEYKKAGSLQALLGGTRTRKYSRRVSEELQDQLYTALGTILERAPSAVVDDVARLLTARAGKYGSEK